MKHEQFSAISRDFELFPATDLNKNKEFVTDKTENTITLPFCRDLIGTHWLKMLQIYTSIMTVLSSFTLHVFYWKD